MKNTLKIASAFIGVVLGAGFATGQEVLQYFTSYGMIGMVGTIIVAILFGVMGMLLVRIGYRIKATSHHEVMHRISGRYIGTVFDGIFIVTLFGIGVVMLAGAGPIFNQQFGIPTFVGTVVMSILVLITVMLGVKKVIGVLAMLTPFLLLVIVFINVHSIVTMEESFQSLESLATAQHSISSHWLISAINYLAVCTLTNAAMLFIMGGNEKTEREASLGGLLGGFLCGILVLISNLALFTNINKIEEMQIPVLELANQISPYLGFLFSFTLFGMIYGTAVSLFFSFGSRFLKPRTTKFNLLSALTLTVACCLGFYGFSDLVSIVFPLIGYFGYIFIIIIVVAAFKYHPVRIKTKNDLGM